MLKPKNHSKFMKTFNICFAVFLSLAWALPFEGFASETLQIKKNQTGLYKDAVGQNIYHEFLNQLDLGRWGRKIFNRELPSKNINIYDEVPDNYLFENRHGKSRLSLKALERGYSEKGGPDLSQPLTVIKGKVSGLHPGFFVKDARGDKYLIKFDAAENLELATGAEVIASRFYHAVGYNVPEYTVAFIDPAGFVVSEDAKYYDDTGFKKPLTQEALDEMLMFLPHTLNGQLRASASKILSGESLGYFSLRSRRKDDPNDIVNHRDRREVRGLIVFSAWLNNNDIRDSNTLDMLVEENGQSFVKHYLIDFNSSLGGAHHGMKPPHFGFEYMGDYGESFKAITRLGLWEKPWQKQWREEAEQEYSSAVGYFSNKEFDPARFKSQLPYDAFRLLTRADGFWAAKIIAAFSDDDIRAMVKAGQLTRSEDVDYLVQMLIERRDAILNYWFHEANPLDQFILNGSQLSFKDLAVQYGFAGMQGRSYVAEYTVQGKQVSGQNESHHTQIELPSTDAVEVEIRVRDAGADDLSPYVRISVVNGQIDLIRHED